MIQTQANDTLREWRESAPYWEKHAETIRVMFAPMTRALLEEAGIHRGQNVLDVAGGAGEPSLTIAETVGDSGSVTCADAAAEMVAAAQREAGRRKLTNVEFRRCDAERLPFDDDSFDAVVSRLGVMFFPDPLAGLREMLRVARPTGALALAVWGRRELNPFSYVVTRVMSRHVETPPEDPTAPGAFRFSELGALAGILEAAGATNVRERLFEFCMEAPISPAGFWTLRSEMSPTLREKLSTLPAEERKQVAREVQQATREFFPNGRMSLPAQAIIATGKKAG